MSVVALGSVRSCGATTLGVALAATWTASRRVLLVEADPAGGTLAAAAGWPPEPGLVSLAAATRRARGHLDDLALVFEHCHALPGGTPVLAAPASGEQARHALSMLEGVLAELADLDADVLVDCGRLEPTTQGTGTAFFAAAELALLVARPRLADLHALGSWLASRAAATFGLSGRLGLVLVGDGPYPDVEVADALGVEVLAHLPYDPEAATALVDVPSSDRSLRRSPLVRATRTLAEHLAECLAGGDRPLVGPAPGPITEPEARRPAITMFRQWRSASTVAPENSAVLEGDVVSKGMTR